MAKIPVIYFYILFVRPFRDHCSDHVHIERFQVPAGNRPELCVYGRSDHGNASVPEDIQKKADRTLVVLSISCS
jgi:hypothetical protein